VIDRLTPAHEALACPQLSASPTAAAAEREEGVGGGGELGVGELLEARMAIFVVLGKGRHRLDCR
jgi:hypothetical protein